MLSFYALLPAFLSVSGGRWIDRIGLRRPMLLGTACLSLAVLTPFFAWDIGALDLASVSVGLAFMIYHLASQKAIGEADSDEERRLNFSHFALGFSVSGFVGPTSAGLLIDLPGTASPSRCWRCCRWRRWCCCAGTRLRCRRIDTRSANHGNCPASPR
jgi:MFS family permease